MQISRAFYEFLVTVRSPSFSFSLRNEMRFSARCASLRGDVATPRSDISHSRLRTMTNIGALNRFRNWYRFRNRCFASLTVSAGREKRAGRLELPGETTRHGYITVAVFIPTASYLFFIRFFIARHETTALGLSFSISLSLSLSRDYLNLL